MEYTITVTDGKKVWDIVYESILFQFSIVEARRAVSRHNQTLKRGEVEAYLVSFDEKPRITSRYDFENFITSLYTVSLRNARAKRPLPWFRRNMTNLRELANDFRAGRSLKDIWGEFLGLMKDFPDDSGAVYLGIFDKFKPEDLDIFDR
jgi:hypothetical protein